MIESNEVVYSTSVQYEESGESIEIMVRFRNISLENKPAAIDSLGPLFEKLKRLL